jgi:methylenetetrahydrofolate dehydrogenase (NADP+)/methenyltetrahydrofolate cyclohydrolase
MDGTALAAKVREKVAREVGELGSLGLATVLVGNDPASEVYIRLKHTDAEQVGIRPIDERLPEDATEADVLALVQRLNADDGVDGIIVQTPLPEHLDEFKLLAAVDAMKDVDGLDAAQRRAAADRAPAARGRDAARDHGAARRVPDPHGRSARRRVGRSMIVASRSRCSCSRRTRR